MIAFVEVLTQTANTEKNPAARSGHTNTSQQGALDLLAIKEKERDNLFLRKFLGFLIHAHEQKKKESICVELPPVDVSDLGNGT